VVKGRTATQDPAGGARRGCSEPDGEVAADLLVSPFFHCSADVDDVVGNDAEANPTFHPGNRLCSGNGY
jgi:hypothetical protein